MTTTNKHRLSRNASGVDEVYVEMWAGNAFRVNGDLWRATPSDQDHPYKLFPTRGEAVAYLLRTMEG